MTHFYKVQQRCMCSNSKKDCNKLERFSKDSNNAQQTAICKIGTTERANRKLFEYCWIKLDHFRALVGCLLTRVHNHLNFKQFSRRKKLLSQWKLIKIWNGVWKMCHIWNSTEHSYLEHSHHAERRRSAEKGMWKELSSASLVSIEIGTTKKCDTKTISVGLSARVCVELSLRSVVITHILSNLKISSWCWKILI